MATKLELKKQEQGFRKIVLAVLIVCIFRVKKFHLLDTMVKFTTKRRIFGARLGHLRLIDRIGVLSMNLQIRNNMEEYLWAQLVQMTVGKIQNGQIITTNDWNILNTK